MQDGGWRPQIREGRRKEDEEILLADRRSSESARTIVNGDVRGSSRTRERGDGEDREGNEFQKDEDESGSEDDEIMEEGGQRGLSRSTKGTIWVVVMTMSTLIGRRLLRGGFRESSFPLELGFLSWGWCCATA